MDVPKIEDVLRNIYDLYQNPDVTTKEKASTWLDKFQKSVSGENFGTQKNFLTKFSHRFRFTRGKSPMIFCSRKTTCTRATLQPKRCAAKSSTRSMNFPRLRTNLSAIPSSRTSNTSRRKQIRSSPSSFVWRCRI